MKGLDQMSMSLFTDSGTRFQNKRLVFLEPVHRIFTRLFFARQFDLFSFADRRPIQTVWG